MCLITGDQEDCVTYCHIYFLIRNYLYRGCYTKNFPVIVLADSSSVSLPLCELFAAACRQLTSSIQIMGNCGSLPVTKAVAMRLLVQHCVPLYDQCHLATASNLQRLLATGGGILNFSQVNSTYQGVSNQFLGFYMT